METIERLFFHLTPTTLAAIVTDLDDTNLWREVTAAMNAGVDNCGAEEFSEYLAAARGVRDWNQTTARDLAGENGTVATILAYQTR